MKLKTIFGPEKDNGPQNKKIEVVISADMQPLIPYFLQEMDDFCHTMLDAVHHKDFKTLTETSHKIKGAGGSYGFNEISSYGKSIEEASRTKDMADVKILLEDFRLYLANVGVSFE